VIPISVLDLAPIVEGGNAAQALHNAADLARHAERWGFARYWLAEHHNMPGIASAATSIAIAHVAAATSTIRVGAGGIMLPNHAPLVIAEQFGTLDALHPGRIDLGLGRAPGTDQNTARALRRSVDALSDDDFPRQLGELIGFFRGSFPEGHPYGAIKAVPSDGVGPPIWLLGSSGYSAQLAGHLGLPFAFAHHFMAQNTLPALELYRRSFQPSDVLAAPYAMVAVQVIAAETDEEARQLALPGALSFLQLRQNNPIPLPTVEEAAAYPWTPEERAFAAQRHEGQAVGSDETVRRQLGELLSATRADELMVTTMVPDSEARLRSMDRVRGMFGAAELPRGLVAA
jgi:luciferase family oxidoreductase group 1